MILASPPAVSASAPAAPNLTAAFTGTIISTYPDGRMGRLWLRPDGVYAARGRRGDPSFGHWRLVGQRLCLRQSRPLPIPLSYCAPLPSTGAASGWSGRAVAGEPITIRVVPGRSGEPQ